MDQEGPRANAGREGTPVLTVVTPAEPTPAATMTGGSLIGEIVRDGARRLLAAALEFHKIGNVLSALPKSAHPGAKKALAEIWNAEDRDHARGAVAAFKLAYGAKFVKAVAKVTDDLDKLLARSTTSPPNTRCICAPPTRSYRPSPPSGTRPRPPKALARRPQATLAFSGFIRSSAWPSPRAATW